MRSSSTIALALLALSTVARASDGGASLPDGGAPSAVGDGGAPAAEVKETSALPATPTGTPAERERWLKGRLDEILGRAALAGAKVGLAVVEVDTGRAVYVRNDALLLNPASNVKIVTTAAALALLGPEYRWKTVLAAEGIHAGSIDGNLYLRGYGDPSLVSEDLWKMASDLAAQGVKKIGGDLVVDDSFFDAERVGPGFEQKSEDMPYRAPNGAVSLNYNAVGVTVLPGKGDGAPARVVIEPSSSYFTTINEVKTVAAGRTNYAIATREIDGHTEVKVTGVVKVGDAGHLEHRRVAHPDLYAGYSLRELFSRRGIKVTGAVKNGTAPAGTRALVAHYSQPLGVVVRDVNKHSNNFMAEQLLKTLGAETGGKPGTWPKGVDAVGKFLDGIGIAKARYKMTNGSGLYDSNRFTATQLVTILRTAYRDFRFAADFVGSLALAGADGTIGHRMEGGIAERWVRAKTGTLDGVSALSGYAGAQGKLPLAFAILMNELAGDATHAARRAQDAIAEALVLFLSGK